MKKYLHKIKRLKKKLHWRKIFLLGGGIFFLCIGFFAIWISTLQIPNLDSFEERRVAQSTKIYDRTGEILLYDVHNNIRRTVVPFEQISDNIKKATVAIEDSEFYTHKGIRPLSIVRAVIANIFTLDFGQGGSTITQQVIKNSLLTKDKLISRKIKEWVLAVKLEKVMDKNSILNAYLNENPYGGNIYGVEEATKTFFGKHASEVTLAEAAYIAALPQAPSYYSPYGTHKDALEKRQKLVLSELLKNNSVTKAEYDKAVAEKVAFLPGDAKSIKAPHFVMYIKDLLEKKYGETAVLEGGMKVITTLDYGLQQKAEELAKKYALENEKNFNAENIGIVAIDPKTGGVLAMVGSRDYFDKEIDGNFNVTLAHRQPGSSFKPFVYATAFEKGYTPETTLFDLQTEFSSECAPTGKPIKEGSDAVCYMPENYDHVYRGPVTMRNALAQSLNIPAIKTLYLAGMKDSLRTAKDMGITSLTNIDRYGLTLVLGGGEVSLLEMTSAYSAFANDGTRNPYTGILSVEDPHGQVLEKFATSSEQVLPEDTARTINDVLSDNNARTPAFGENSALYIPGRQVAAKTGTTNDYKDAWIIGYTPSIAIGAWAGNNNNTPMEKKVAGMIIAPLWNAVMREALQTLPNETFNKPAPIDYASLKPVLHGVWQGGTSYFTDSFSGNLATEYTPIEAKTENVIQSVHSILYWVNKDDPRGPAPSNPAADPQFNNWEYAVRKWAAERGYNDAGNVSIPQTSDTLHTRDSKPIIRVLSPSSEVVYQRNGTVQINVGVESKYPISRIEVYMNGTLMSVSKQPTLTTQIKLNELTSINKNNELKIVAVDTIYNKTEYSQNVEVNI